MMNLNAGTWCWACAVVNPDSSHPNLVPYVTAVFNGVGTNGTDYVTYVSWADGYAGALTEIKDWTFLFQTRSTSWQPANLSCGPTLVDLGDDNIAVMHMESYQAFYYKYSKSQHKVPSPYEYSVPFSSADQGGWAVEGVVFSAKVSDPNSPTGYRMNSDFYAIVENNPVWDEANWEFVKCENYGYWMPIASNHIDFAGGDLPVDQVKQRLSDTFDLWPVLGVVDMPPYVENGHGVCANRLMCGTEVEMSFLNATNKGLAGDYSAGPYVETGHRSKVVVDAGAGYAGGFENSTNITYTHYDVLENNREGRIYAYYIVPAFNAYTLQWHDLNGTATDTYTTSVELTGVTVRKESFDPVGQGPDMSTLPAPYLDLNAYQSHKSENDRERLDSYSINPTDATHNFQTIVDSTKSATTWGHSSPGSFGWAIDSEHSIDNGGYCSLKIGYEVAKKIGFGVEGEVQILVNTKTQTGVEAKTTLLNQDPLDETDPARVTSFSVQGYWLKPASNGYWIPKNRVGMGDSPWFITYRVTDYWP